MTLRTRLSLILVAAAVVALSGPLTARQQPSERPRPVRPDFDIREYRPPAPGSVRARAELRRAAAGRSRRGSRLDPHTGALRVLDAPDWASARTAPPVALRNTLGEAADRLGLDDEDLRSLTVVRDYVSRTTGLRHVTFAQAFDDIPVFDGTVTVHIASSGEIVRVTSSAGRGEARRRNPTLAAEEAATVASNDINPEALFVPVRVGGSARTPVQGQDSAARFARGRFLRDVTASLVWFAMEGGLRLAWHVELEPDGLPQFYDVLIDAESGELLLRRNRVLDANGRGRVVQLAATQAIDARRPDQMPIGAGACPPPVNHELRDLTAPFRDPSTVLSDMGRLSGNNVHVFRGNTTTEGTLGTFDGARWLFDFPFNSAASAETALFFSLNFAHDFFYDLGFDEAAGNFQASNFGRGGLGGDPIAGVARAAGRNNATFMRAPEGTSPVISMFLWDGLGCWSEDVDGDGTQDLDGDFDTDIVLHEFHHGVSHRLNTAFNGNEAGAIGEGGSDFFAYSINGDTSLAEYSRPGGLRGVNGKTYNEWSCLLGVFCEPHDNGEIWANVLWDVRERFRLDLVRGSERAAVSEAHQLYIDGLKLSPPSPTMLDLRDAMLEADTLRNPGSPESMNFCALWESFAARGMGVNATDTADNGFNRVGANFAVPPGCNAPPGPPAVTLAVTAAIATEAGPTNGTFTISRDVATDAAIVVNFTVAGTATRGSDYLTLPTTATIPAGAVSVDVPVVPIDDSSLEVNQTVVLTLRSGSGYVLGVPATGTVTIVSDDVAPDFTMAALTVPAMGGPGLTLTVTDTTRNQGTGPSDVSTTSFYLSVNTLLDAGDTLLGTRAVPGLSSGSNDTATTVLTVPAAAGAGSYYLIAKADGPGLVSESIETNNTRLALVRIGPDLAITALTAPATAGAGATIVVTQTTKNQGGGSADGSSTRFYLSSNSALDAGDVALEARSVGPLASGSSTAATTNVTIPANVTSGSFYLIAAADDGHVVPESIETNNTRYVLVRIGADLVVSTIAAPARGAAGATIAVTDTTKNMGGGGAGSSTTAFYLSSNLTLDAGDARLTGARAVGPLDAGASSVGTTAVTLPAVASGTWYLMANADDSSQVAETQETNNVRYTTIYIGADLAVSGLNAPSTVVAGATMTVTDTVKNFGAETAAPSTTRFYLSLNISLDAADIPLDAQRAVPALGFNATNTGSTSVAIPAGLSGRYYLLAVADGLAVVVESNEVNNVLSRPVTINPGP
jgi:subtilase family serine protease